MKPMKTTKVVGYTDRKTFNEIFEREPTYIDTTEANNRFKNMFNVW